MVEQLCLGMKAHAGDSCFIRACKELNVQLEDVLSFNTKLDRCDVISHCSHPAFGCCPSVQSLEKEQTGAPKSAVIENWCIFQLDIHVIWN
ncbi:hypothetical protein Q9966_000670 [Columba livia]|nr:hypothetical protein Q9966_000670 [Columba livia]